jgi:hypothetical protein
VAETKPLFTVTKGKRYLLIMNNNSGDEHPVHLHRHSFEITKVADKPTSGVIKDTISLPRCSTAEIDFVADDPGATFLHCHHQDHMDEGFAGLITYHGVWAASCYWRRACSNSSTRFPEASLRRICEPPGPVTISLRNCTPAARNRATSPGRSSQQDARGSSHQVRGERHQASGRPAELVGPLSSSRSDPSVTSANAGA